MRRNETGRSMVEMLGVLAIIGVLSIGALAGFNMAMLRYKTNELANAIDKLFVLIETEAVNAEETHGYITYEEAFGTTPQEGLPNLFLSDGNIGAGYEDFDSSQYKGRCYYVTFNRIIDLRVCDILENLIGDKYNILYCSGDETGYNEASIYNNECKEYD